MDVKKIHLDAISIAVSTYINSPTIVLHDPERADLKSGALGVCYEI